MASSSSFRFRDQGIGDSTDSDVSSGESLESSIGDEESNLESMTGKGINHLCSELLELKRVSEEDFHRTVYSNYSVFVRIFEKVGGMEKGLKQLKQHVSTQRKLVKDLIDGIYLEILSKETIESIIEDSMDAVQFHQSKLEAHTNAISETLDILLLEHRVDEALAILEMEAGNVHMKQLEEDYPPQVLMSYDSAIAERKSRLADIFFLVAEHPRVAAPDFQRALTGLCRLGDCHRATQLLLKFYHSRLANGIYDLQCAKLSSHGTYIRELAKLVFSVISQAARSFVVLYGETSPYASELIQWAREETEVFVHCFGKYVKSISEINGGLSMVVDAVQVAISFCSLLETQRIVLRPWLIKLIRPCLEEVLQIHIHHLKKVIGIFTTTDNWVLGKYLDSGIVKEESCSMVIGHKLEYCLLTNSGRKFVTLLQAILKDISPLVMLQMESSILKGIVELFIGYIDVLERAISDETNVVEKVGSRISLAHTLSQKLSVLANSSTLVQFFSSITRSIFKGMNHINGESMEDHTMVLQQEEFDSYIFLIQEATDRLTAYFCQQFIYKIMSPEGVPKLSPEAYIGRDDSDMFQDLMPSDAFQVLFLEVRKLEKLAKENFVGEDWLVKEVLMELMENLFVWLSNDQEFWTIIEENSIDQQSRGFEQFVLDMQFLVEITRFGGYFSDNMMDAALVLTSRMESAFLFAGLNPKRHANDGGWAASAATEAILRLQEIEKTKLPPTEEPTRILEEDPDKHQGIQEFEIALLEEPLDLEEEDNLDNEDAQISTDSSIDSGDMEVAKSATAAIGKVQGIKETDIPAVVVLVDNGEEASDEQWVEGGGPLEDRATSPFDDSMDSIDEQEANVVDNSMTNKLEGDTGSPLPTIEGTELVNKDSDKLQAQDARDHVDKDEFVLEENYDKIQDVGNVVKHNAADRNA